MIVTKSIQREAGEIEVFVEYILVSRYVGVTDGRYGPKLEQDEPAHVEIEGVYDRNGADVELTDAEARELVRWIGDTQLVGD